MIYALGRENGFLMSIINEFIIKITSSLIGTDEFNNKYYQSRKKLNAFGKKKRYVIYGSNVDISNIPPMWHCWLHYMIDDFASKNKTHSWIAPYKHNETGTINAYKKVNIESSIYKKWQPN